MFISGLVSVFMAIVLVVDVIAFMKMAYPRPRLAFYPGGALVATVKRMFGNKHTEE